MSKARSLKIVIEGARAEAATRDLFSMGWFEAEWERERRTEVPGTDDEHRPAPASTVSAQVLALAGGCVTIADKMLGWWENWQKAEATSVGAGDVRLAVVLEAPGTRVSLENASRDALVEVLRVLHPPSR